MNAQCTFIESFITYKLVGFLTPFGILVCATHINGVLYNYTSWQDPSLRSKFINVQLTFIESFIPVQVDRIPHSAALHSE